MDLSKQAILRTILYADIFNFPLTVDEIWRYCITPKKLSRSDVRKTVADLCRTKILIEKDKFITVFDKSKNIQKRIKNKEILLRKDVIAKNATSILSEIPSIMFIGISGSLAARDSHEDDDIDLFIIAQEKYMWVTRGLSLAVLSRAGLRRSRGIKHEKDTICLNMFLSSNALTFPKSRQDMYTAREIAQIKPLFQRRDMYQRFLNANTWSNSYLANSFSMRTEEFVSEKASAKFDIWYRSPMIQLAEIVQRVYMYPHKTTEQVTNSLFAFHPHDYRKQILSVYAKRLKKYSVE